MQMQHYQNDDHREFAQAVCLFFTDPASAQLLCLADLLQRRPSYGIQDSASEINEYVIIAASKIVCKAGIFRVRERLWILKPTLMSGHTSAEIGADYVQGLYTAAWRPKVYLMQCH